MNGFAADRIKTRYIQALFCVIVVMLCALRFWHLTADFPNYTMWGSDQAKFTDEGWWASAAVDHRLTGHWTVPGDYNPGVALPVWPMLLAVLFHWTGVSLIAARALNVALSVGTVGLVWLVLRRFVEQRTAMLAVLLVASSPFAFVFSRLATLDTLVLFEFCAMLVVVTFIEEKRLLSLALLTLLTTAMVLTKTTAVVFLPGIFYLAWMRSKSTAAGCMQIITALGIVPAILFGSHEVLVDRAGFGLDYRYFYETNSSEDMDWSHAFGTMSTLLHNSFWVDRFVYPLTIVVLVLSIIWLRSLWKNSLFTASWVVIACQVGFIFRRQQDYAPRYWLALLLPMIFCVVLTLDDLRVRSRGAYRAGLFAVAAVIVINTTTILGFAAAANYQFYSAAMSIKKIVSSDVDAKPLMLGVSASEFSLATGIPSINDAFGSQELNAKVRNYRPGWYLVWNKIGAENHDALPPFRLERAASYPMFDDHDRDELILYRIVAPDRK